jgi:hypothetical protein
MNQAISFQNGAKAATAALGNNIIWLLRLLGAVARIVTQVVIDIHRGFSTVGPVSGNECEFA